MEASGGYNLLFGGDMGRWKGEQRGTLLVSGNAGKDRCSTN